MSGSIKKIQAITSFPLSKNNNQLSFNVSNEFGQIDMKSSYIELEVDLVSPTTGAPMTNKRGVTLGHDGLFYNASCLFRDAKLIESSSNKSIADTMYVNVLSNNLEYFSKGCNHVAADALYDGKGHPFYSPLGLDASANITNNQVLSVFNNKYPDEPYSVVRCPLSLLYPGSIGDADLFPQTDELTFRYYLEPQFNCFQRSVPSGLYEGGALTETQLKTTVAMDDVAHNVDNIKPKALNNLVRFHKNQSVLILATNGGVVHPFVKKVMDVVQDSGTTIGHIVIDSPLSATLDYTLVAAEPITNEDSLACYAAGVDGDGNLTTLKLLNEAVQNKDLYQSSKVRVDFMTMTAEGVVSYELKSVHTNVLSLTLNANDCISDVVIQDNLNSYVPAGGYLINVSIVPLYTNITDNWILRNAHMVMYRRNVPLTHQSKMLTSNFSSVNYAMVGGLNKSMYSLKAPNNCYNVYAFTPGETNLFSTTQQLSQYLISVDDVPLTQIYINTGNSALHKDNLVRVLSNSPYYQPKNLDGYRDKEVEIGSLEPDMCVGKIFHSLMKGDPHVQPFEAPDRNVKVELVATGAGTPQKMVYVFLEKWDTV